MVELVGVHFGHVDGKPFLEFCSRHRGPAFGVIFSLFFNIGKCGAFETVSSGKPSPKSALNMPTVVWLPRWTVLYDDVVVVARTADHRTTELLGIVAVDFSHLPPARLICRYTDLFEPMLFG